MLHFSFSFVKRGPRGKRAARRNSTASSGRNFFRRIRAIPAGIKLREMTHKIEHFPNISTRIQVRGRIQPDARALSPTRRWRNGQRQEDDGIRDFPRAERAARGWQETTRGCSRRRRRALRAYTIPGNNFNANEKFSLSPYDKQSR